MPDRKDQKESAETQSNPPETRLEPGGEAVVIYEDMPVRPEADKRIHSRRPLPAVPEGSKEEKEEDRQNSAPFDSGHAPTLIVDNDPLATLAQPTIQGFDSFLN